MVCLKEGSASENYLAVKEELADLAMETESAVPASETDWDPETDPDFMAMLEESIMKTTSAADIERDAAAAMEIARRNETFLAMATGSCVPLVAVPVALPVAPPVAQPDAAAAMEIARRNKTFLAMATGSCVPPVAVPVALPVAPPVAPPVALPVPPPVAPPQVAPPVAPGDVSPASSAATLALPGRVDPPSGGSSSSADPSAQALQMMMAAMNMLGQSSLAEQASELIRQSSRSSFPPPKPSGTDSDQGMAGQGLAGSAPGTLSNDQCQQQLQQLQQQQLLQQQQRQQQQQLQQQQQQLKGQGVLPESGLASQLWAEVIDLEAANATLVEQQAGRQQQVDAAKMEELRKAQGAKKQQQDLKLQQEKTKADLKKKIDEQETQLKLQMEAAAKQHALKKQLEKSLQLLESADVPMAVLPDSGMKRKVTTAASADATPQPGKKKSCVGRSGLGTGWLCDLQKLLLLTVYLLCMSCVCGCCLEVQMTGVKLFCKWPNITQCCF